MSSDRGVGEAAEPHASTERIPLFRGRARAKEFAAQLDELRSRVDRLGLLPIVELESRRASLEAETATLAESLERERADAAAAVEKETAEATSRAEKTISELQLQERDLAPQLGETPRRSCHH